LQVIVENLGKDSIQLTLILDIQKFAGGAVDVPDGVWFLRSYRNNSVG